MTRLLSDLCGYSQARAMQDLAQQIEQAMAADPGATLDVSSWMVSVVTQLR